MDPIINKVAESGIITLDLKGFYPSENFIIIDIKDYLFKELILKEKEYRSNLKQTDWQRYSEKEIIIANSTNALVPMWAYMLLVSYLEPFTKNITFGNESEIRKVRLLYNISQINPAEYAGKRVVIKGCGDLTLPEAAYVAITLKLKPVVKSLMFGEPCSSVPVFKAATNTN